MDFLDKMAAFVRPYCFSVAVAIVATTLAIFGGFINSVIRVASKKMHFFARFFVYILVYAFGVGFLSAVAVKFLNSFLRTLPSGYLFLFIIGVFLLLCFVARKEKQI
ncbi:hypothetical protein AGMMS49938_02510 [Fibrobacterales bacterium]|nr:hypothetical protein AGMMS49938_02510 [Fibrobacterales bacterium]